MVVEDDRKVIAVHCPGVTIHDIRVEYYDGVSKGEIKIDRKEAQGVPSLQWGWTFHFDSHHEFVQSETRLGFLFSAFARTGRFERKAAFGSFQPCLFETCSQDRRSLKGH